MFVLEEEPRIYAKEKRGCILVSSFHSLGVLKKRTCLCCADLLAGSAGMSRFAGDIWKGDIVLVISI
jgi:hypothetical protein